MHKPPINAIYGVRCWLSGFRSLIDNYRHIPIGRPAESRIPPKQNNLCGFYAFKPEKVDPKEYFGTFMGVVALWGKIVEHEMGYRGQFMLPVYLGTPLLLPKEGVEELNEYADFCEIFTPPKEMAPEQARELVSIMVRTKALKRRGLL